MSRVMLRGWTWCEYGREVRRGILETGQFWLVTMARWRT
jgi:hypothetical protein